MDAKRIRVWCSQKHNILALKKDGKSGRKRLHGAGRRVQDWDMEEALFSWIVELRSHHLHVSCAMIRVQARVLSTVSGFEASRGWLGRFMKRHSLSLHQKMTVCQKLPADCIPQLASFKVPADCIPQLASFIKHLRTLQICHKYPRDCMFAMDETACWMGMPSDTTVAFTGAHSVPLNTTGHEKENFTIILSAKADGTKIKPFVVFKGKGLILGGSQE